MSIQYSGNAQWMKDNGGTCKRSDLMDMTIERDTFKLRCQQQVGAA